ncbi:MAG: hypothetical protein IT366_08225 [Candidatus Hydrogenedentes bacterium]|nr:hypothetical protein [Candidatus Hydrogenedentota bacterium]
MALSGVASVCVNHPSVEAVGRCKQCSKPFCAACKIQGPTGFFCSADCKQKHEVFVKRAQSLDVKKGGLGIGYALSKMMGWAIAVLIIAVVLVVAGTIFNIPVLSPIVHSVRGTIGF